MEKVKHNIIFLDFDGVLNGDEFFVSQRRKAIACGLSITDSKLWNIEFKDESIVDKYWANHMDWNNIKHLIGLEKQIPNLAIVLSTSWRNGKTITDWNKQFNNIVGWNIPIIGKTSFDINKQLTSKEVYEMDTIEGFIKEEDARGREAMDWLICNADIVKNYVVIDDFTGDMLICQKDNCVTTDESIGLTENDVDKMIEILGGTHGEN